MRGMQRGASVAALAAVVWSCSPMMVDPVLEVTAAPRTIRNDGLQISVLSLLATDSTGAPGTGAVRVRATAGSLKDAMTVMLAGGKRDLDFTCSLATDPGCTGNVRITAEWTVGGRLVEATATVTVVAAPPDAGMPVDSGTMDAGGVDAGIDAGVPVDAGAPIDGGLDAGPILDGGSFDGGFFGTYRLTVVNVERPTILTGVMDEVDVTFQLSFNSASMVPVPGQMATITVDRGASFTPVTPFTSSTTKMTDGNGRFTVTVYSGSSTRGPLSIIASALDAQVTAIVRAIDVASITYTADPMRRSTLAISSTGMAISTPVAFRVTDAMGMPVEDVDVTFTVAANSAAGCTVVPLQARSNNMGIVRTTLTAGDSQGTATVLARVVGSTIAETPSENFNIIIGRVNEGRMALSCARTTIGALQTPTPPRNDRDSVCTVTLVDRNGRTPPFALNVSWLSEAGNLPPTSTFTGLTNTAAVTFNSGGNMPVLTSPLPAVGPPFPAPAEPFFGTTNPRDFFVTIVAAVQGEEEFVDGSGASRGVTNQVWDPGEYWIDLPEPFADSNDNGTWDPNEPYIDTDRVNCATGQTEPRNQRWDGPNGCWDRATQVWKPTHVVYGGSPASGSALSNFITITPSLPAFMAAGTNQLFDIAWTDPAFNRFSSDSASIQVVPVGTVRGSASIAIQGIIGESFGQDLQYLSVRAQTLPDAGFLEEGPCDFSEPDAGFPGVRCLRTYKFRGWRTSSPRVTMNVTAPSAQSPFTDGGIPPPTTSTWQLRAQNALDGQASIYQFSIAFP